MRVFPRLDRGVKVHEAPVVRAAVARRRELVVTDVADPVPGPGEALVAVKACGICGSDLHTLVHAEALLEVADAVGNPTEFDPTADFVMGHEFSAEVLELGPETDGAPVAPGDLVVSLPLLFGPSGAVALGFDNKYPGAYAERMLLTSAICLKVPDGLDARRAALTEPMAVGRHAVNRSGITPGDAALVHGCGPLGLATIAWLRVDGIEPIVAADFSPRRRALAAALGAHAVVDPAVEPAIDTWRRIDGLRPLVIFEAVGVPGMLDRITREAPPQARVCIIGVCMENDTLLPLVPVVKELSFQFVFGYDPLEFTQTLDAIAEGRLDVAPLISGTVGIDGVPEAFAALAEPDDHVKILVEPDGGPPTVTPP